MKNTIIALFACLILQNCIAQDWLWSRQVGGKDKETVGYNALCMDMNNDLYVAGSYESNPCFFDGDSVNVLSGPNDLYIEKLNSDGTKIWVKTFGGLSLSADHESISNLCFDPFTNSIYFTGRYYGSIAFDTTILGGAGQGDAFVVRMDLNGNTIWAKHISGGGEDRTFAMALDNYGNIFLEVYAASSAIFDTEFIPNGENIIKLDSSGAMQWHVNKFPPNGSNIGSEAQFFQMKAFDNKLFAIGMATTDTLCSDTTLTYLNFTIQQNIIACMDASNGTTRWIRACGSNTPQIMNIAVDSYGNSIITGSFYSMAIFESDTLRSPNLSELFLAKYDSSGGLVFSKQCTSSVGAYGSSIALNDPDGFYVAGSLRGTVSFDSFSISTAVGSDLFVARYDSSGQCIGVRHLGQGYAWSILAIPYSDIYVAGGFYNSVTFGSNATLTSYGQSDAYIASTQPFTGLQNPESADHKLVIFANPNRGICQVRIPEALLYEDKLTLQIIDNLGRLILHKEIAVSDTIIELNLESEASGIYMVRLTGTNAVYFGKIVIQ